MKRFYHSYLNSFRGLSQPTWMLAVVILINRTGAMVLPFLGIYMTTVLGFDLKQAGLVLSCFGVGAVLGSVAGGWLTDRFGHFHVQTISLFLVVPVFLSLPFLKTLPALSIGVFMLSTIADIFRPANSVSISHYAKPENITRAFSLNRMALNLGFSMGPALGGFLAAISYHLLFYGNAVSSAIAGVVFFLYFRKRESKRKKQKTGQAHNLRKPTGLSPWKDADFLIFSFLCFVYSMCFFQLMSTLPLYYKSEYLLTDRGVGFLMAFNGLVVFTLEMFLVSVSEKVMRMAHIIILGTVLCALSFLILLTGFHIGILYLSMFFLSVSEIFLMPFSATVAIRRATKGREGAYMGMNSLSFAAAFMFSPLLGTGVADKFSFDRLWMATAVVALLVGAGFWWNLKRMENKEVAAGIEQNLP